MHLDDAVAVAAHLDGRASARGTAAHAAAVHPVLAAAFVGLDSADVPWLLLRGADDLARPTGDVDLLVDRAALPLLDDALRTAGLIRLGSRGHGSHRFYFRYVAEQDLWITLDVVTEIQFGGFQQLHSPLAATVLERRRRVGRLWRPAPDDESWLFLLHLLLDKGQVPSGRRHAAQLAALRADTGGPVAGFLDRRISDGSARRIPAAVIGEEPGDCEALARELARQWHRAQWFGAHRRRVVNHLLRRFAVPIRWSDRGLVMALVGPDGAGKTTVADALRENHPLPSRAVHMGIWREGRWDHRLATIPGGLLLQRTTRIVRGSLATRYHRARGRLVVLDRFAHDVLLPGVVDTSRGGRFNRRLSLWMAPEPDVVLLLDAPGELMFARKGEHSPQVLEQRRQGYLAMVTGMPQGAVLDATRPVDEVVRAASAVVWEAIAGAGTAGTICPTDTGRAAS